jgi:hypothetical protein
MRTPVDALLRYEGRHAVGRGKVPWIELALITAAGGFIYGAVMGCYGVRPLQALYSGLKVPLLLGVSTVICLPSFYVINALLGLRDDMAASFRGVLAAQATLAISLAVLAPITVVIYLSIPRYSLAIFFNGIQFAIATAMGQLTLTHHYRPLIRANPRHRIGKLGWLALYVFVAIQMAWVLRPFIGAPSLPTRFFREEAWSNAYVEIAGLLGRVLGGL